MITPSTEQAVASACRRLCDTLGLDQVYLAETVGPRRHYLAGYGKPSFDKPEQLRLSDRIALLWHGTISPEIRGIIRRDFRSIINLVERELSSREPSHSGMHHASQPKGNTNMHADPLTPYGNRPMVTPIVNAVNYEYASFEVLRQITDGEIDGYTYHRDDNPTVREVEHRIAALEKAEDCIVCTSGMAACTMTYLTYLHAGDHLIIFHDTYGANYKVCLILEQLGIDITWVDASDADQIEKFLKPNTRMIFLETPSNPLCKIIDLARIRQAADTVGAMMVVDNTFATPYHQLPLRQGADLVIHSATKALGGHNDVMAGAIAGSKEHYNELWFTRQAIGTTLDAYSAFLLSRGLKTFELRAATVAQTAQRVAEALADHAKISRLFYPGLPSHPGHEIAQKQMFQGFGGLMSFDVGGCQDDAKEFIKHLKVIYHAVSLGATESLICIPYLTTMLYLPPERRTSFGVKENTVRLSIGIEPAEHILEDIDQALAAA